MELPLFDQVADLVRAMTPDELGRVRMRAHRRGVKVWFDTDTAPKEHYEAQLLARRHVDALEGMALEIGFHTEHGDLERNVAVIDRVVETEEVWREQLGDEAEVDTFFGAENWRRISEAWIEPDLDDPDLAFEIAGRLVDYMSAIEDARA